MFKNMKIGKKLIAFFLLAAIISGIGSVIGLCVMTNISASYNNALVNYGFSQGDIGLFSTEFNRSRVITSDIVIDTDAQKVQSNSDELDKSIAKINTYFTNIKKTMITEKEINYYNDIKDNLAKFETVNSQIVALAKQNKKAEAHALTTEQAMPITKAIRASTDGLINVKTTSGNQLAGSLASQAATSTALIIAIIVLALVISILIAIKIARGISKPLGEMLNAANRMAEGDLNAQINIDSKNEIGQLGAAFSKSTQTIKAYIVDLSGNLSKMAQGDLRITKTVEYQGDFIQLSDSMVNIVHSFNDALTQMNQASQQVSAGSEQVSNGAQALAQGATEQASSIEELSASISEIAEHVKQNASHATEASEKVTHVSTELEKSNQQMQQMTAAMSNISDSSNKISNIIKTIEDIAFQTNILALNAAVEAARAGEAGKGFAVVADEVRNLASKSAVAAQDTTTLIQGSIKEVEAGTKIADSTANALLQVVGHAEAVAAAVDHISQTSNQQANSINQVTLGIEQVSAVVQTNSATAEESAAASEELSGQAQAMKILVGKFKLRDETNQNLDSKPQSAKEKAEQSRFGDDKY